MNNGQYDIWLSSVQNAKKMASVYHNQLPTERVVATSPVTIQTQLCHYLLPFLMHQAELVFDACRVLRRTQLLVVVRAAVNVRLSMHH